MMAKSPSSSATERMREYRERKRENARCFMGAARPLEVEALCLGGWLSGVRAADDRLVLGEAIEAVLRDLAVGRLRRVRE